VPTSGITLLYAWMQVNDSTPQPRDIGFWTSLNGASAYAKATSYACTEAPTSSLDHPTAGDRAYRCTATMGFDFERYPQLLTAAYGQDGHRTGWDVQVAVSLDEHGTWDSLGGRNYRFSL
jgi:hypothetical protein